MNLSTRATTSLPLRPSAVHDRPSVRGGSRHLTVVAATPGPQGPQRLSGLAQRASLWQKIEQTHYDDRSLPALDAPMAKPLRAMGVIARMLADKCFRDDTVFEPFDVDADLRPSREKLFHTFGTTAQCTFIPADDSPFDGLFKSGTQTAGLVRLSLASDENNYVPGVALKFFVEGKPSINIMALPSLDAQSSKDFFARNPSTHFPPARQQAPKVLEGVLGFLSRGRKVDPRRIDVAPMASVHSDGTPTADAKPSVPAALTLHPARHLASDTRVDFRLALRDAFAPGDTLYDVWSAPSPDDAESGASSASFKLGTLRLDSRFEASTFGDRVLAFKHAG